VKDCLLVGQNKNINFLNTSSSLNRTLLKGAT